MNVKIKMLTFFFFLDIQVYRVIFDVFIYYYAVYLLQQLIVVKCEMSEKEL